MKRKAERRVKREFKEARGMELNSDDESTVEGDFDLNDFKL
jgi:hypothetical protein